MARAVTFPGGVVLRGAGVDDQAASPHPDWGVYADECWAGWPGSVLDWPDFGVPRDDPRAIAAIIEAVARARSGQDVMVGCRGGVGRTGTILAAVAVLTGVPASHARDWVRARYDPDAVETDGQREWIQKRFATDGRVHHLAEKSRAQWINTTAHRLRTETSAALSAADPLPRLAWAIPDVLAITQRPLRADPSFGGTRRDYAREARPAIDAWISDLVRRGITSVIVLTSNQELRHYDAPTANDGGLLALYESRGLEVAHLPADDPVHDVTAKAAFDVGVDALSLRAADALRSMTLPAVMHCSAAIDRSPPVAARIAWLAEVDAM